MSPTAARRMTRAIIGVALAMIALSFVVRLASPDHGDPGRIVVVGNPSVGDGPEVHRALLERQAAGETFSDGALDPFWLIALVVGLLWMVTGSSIVSRQPGNLAGWSFIAIGFALPAGLLANTLAVIGVRTDPGSVPFVGLWATINEYVLVPIVLLPMLFLLFPDGHPPTRAWRWVAWAWLAGFAIAIVGSALTPGPLNNLVESGILYANPIGIPALVGVADTITAIGVVISLIAGFSTIFAVRGRFKRSTGVARQQLRWLVFVATTAGLLFMVVLIGGLAMGDGSFPIVPIGLACLAAVVAFGVPAAYLIAIMKYRLYDLDLVIRKTVVVGAMALFIALVYAVIVGLGSQLFDSSTLSFAAAVVLALAFQPVRERARKLADRLVYGKRATPYEVLADFSGRMGEAYAADDVLPRMAQVLAAGTGAEIAVVWLHVEDALEPVAIFPTDATPPERPPVDAVNVLHQGERLGALSVTMPASDPMDPARHKLVEDLAAQAGLVLRNVRLIGELRASRQRLVAAQDEERRKLERNIHDGAQQQLVALSVQLKLARTMLDRDLVKTGEILDGLHARAGEALEDLRDLARGIYPPLLADKGLVAALEAQARKAAVPTTVEASQVGRYAEAAESSVYFCVLEALNNVAKYAGATATAIILTQSNGDLRFTVSDDGRGFDPAATGYGTGLQGMRDRVSALGGTLTIEAARGAGVTVSGSVPAVPAAANG
jgi:signal transduction histidine kinase